MKKIFLLLFIVLQFACTKKEQNYTPSFYLTPQEQANFKYQVVRYIDDLAKNASHKSKFDSIYDVEYKTRASKLEILYLYKDTVARTTYFAITKIAPSLKLKKVATIGQVKIDKNGTINFYEERCRTWKMEPKELNEKTKMLFEKYINQEDLTEFYTANSQPNFYIEFPDDYTYFDTISRMWISKNRLN